MAYTTAASCTTLTIYHPLETFIESIHGQKSEEQLRKDLLIQLMDSVFKQALKLEKNFQRNLANKQNRYEATDQQEKIQRRKYTLSALQQFPDKRSQYEIRGHRTMNIMIFLVPDVIKARYI